MYEIEWTRRAAKQFRKLDGQVRRSVSDAVDTLADLDSARNVKPLTNHVYDYRLRIGNYRVLFNVEKEIEIVSIEEVKKRDERTY